MAVRIFLEWFCMGWVTAEKQKLVYQCQHQMELHADCYKNIREVLEARKLEVTTVMDAMHGEDHHPRIGKKVLLSTTIHSWRRDKGPILI